MVANAGIAQVVPLIELSPEDFDRMMSTNLRGVFLCYQAAARQMIEQGDGGKIIGAASIVAYRPFPLLGLHERLPSSQFGPGLLLLSNAATRLLPGSIMLLILLPHTLPPKVPLPPLRALIPVRPISQLPRLPTGLGF